MTTPFPFTSGQTLLAANLNAITELVTNTQTDDYTLAATDAGDRVIANKATAIVFTVPNSVFTASQIVRIHNIGAGVLTLSAGAGLTLNGADVLTLSQYQGGELFFTSASSAIFFPTAKTVTSISGTTATVATSQTTTSTSFIDLATSGPSVTVTTGTSVLVFVSAFMENTNEQVQCDFAISGATTRSASATTSLLLRNNAGQGRVRATVVNLMTVTAGSNTFTMKYSVNGGTGTFAERAITVVPL